MAGEEAVVTTTTTTQTTHIPATSTMGSLKAQLTAAAPEYLILVGLAAIGFLVLLRLGTRLLRGIWVVFLRPGKKLRRYGPWAVVTGATDGIGKGFAQQLARQKLNVVLISRTLDKLTALKTELEGKYGVEVRIVAADFTEPDLDATMDRVEQAISDLEVGILVNNVGMSYPYAQYFTEVDMKLIKDLIRVNVETLTRMTRLVVGPMLKRRRGAIINIGSGAASVLPSEPLYAVYAGTKGYVDQFSRTLYVEYQNFGIDVQCQAPLYVATRMSKIRKATLTAPSPSTYARYALSWVGYEPRCTPFWAHSIIWWLVSILPESLVDTLRLRMNLSIRKRALEKEVRKQLTDKQK